MQSTWLMNACHLPVPGASLVYVYLDVTNIQLVHGNGYVACVSANRHYVIGKNNDRTVHSLHLYY